MKYLLWPVKFCEKCVVVGGIIQFKFCHLRVLGYLFTDSGWTTDRRRTYERNFSAQQKKTCLWWKFLWLCRSSDDRAAHPSSNFCTTTIPNRTGVSLATRSCPLLCLTSNLQQIYHSESDNHRNIYTTQKERGGPYKVFPMNPKWSPPVDKIQQNLQHFISFLNVCPGRLWIQFSGFVYLVFKPKVTCWRTRVYVTGNKGCQEAKFLTPAHTHNLVLILNKLKSEILFFSVSCKFPWNSSSSALALINKSVFDSELVSMFGSKTPVCPLFFWARFILISENFIVIANKCQHLKQHKGKGQMSYILKSINIFPYPFLMYCGKVKMQDTL